MRVKNNPSCQCCESCEVPPLPEVSYWTSESGDWSFNVGGPEISEDGIAYTTKFIDVLEGYSKVTVDVHVTEEAASIAILLAYVDADNHLGAEVQFGPDGCGYVRLYQRAGGVGTTLRDWEPVKGLVHNQTTHIEACFNFQPELGTSVFSCLVPTEDGARGICAFGVTTGATLSAAGLRAEEDLDCDFTFTNWHWFYVYDAYDHPLCPKCFGNQPCLIMEAPAALPVCEWNEESGIGDFDTATLRTSVPFARLITEAQNPVVSNNGHIESDVEFDTADDSAIAILGWYDSDNYCYAKVTVGEECGSITVGQAVSGSITETSQPMLSAIPGSRLSMCFDLIEGAAKLIVTPYDDVGQVSGGVRQVQAALTVHDEGFKAGLAVGGITGEVTFRTWGWFLTPVESALCEPCHTCAQHNDGFQRHYSPPTLGCEWSNSAHALTEYDGGRHKLVLAPGETVTSQIVLYGIGVVAEVDYDFPDGDTSIRLSIGDKWAERDGATLRDSQGEEDTVGLGGRLLRLCLHDGVSRATVGSVAAFVTSSATPSSKVVSITNTGPENLDIFTFNAVARSIDDEICLGCPSQCPMCEDNAWPSLVVSISGMAHDPDSTFEYWGVTEDCCSLANGTYYLNDGGYIDDPTHTVDCQITGVKCSAYLSVELCDEDTAHPIEFGITVYIVKNVSVVTLWVVLEFGDTSSGTLVTYLAIWKKVLTETDGIIDCLALSEVLTSSDLQVLYDSGGGCSEPSSSWVCNDADLSGIVINVQAV